MHSRKDIPALWVLCKQHRNQVHDCLNYRYKSCLDDKSMASENIWESTLENANTQRSKTQAVHKSCRNVCAHHNRTSGAVCSKDCSLAWALHRDQILGHYHTISGLVYNEDRSMMQTDNRRSSLDNSL